MQRLILIGASTGGTRVLPGILARLAAPRACVVIVQHMPEFIGQSLVRTLAGSAHLPVQLAAHGDRLQVGRIYLIPGGRHGLLSHNSQITLSDGPRVNFVRPSVDVLMTSVVLPSRDQMLAGVILTGMGRDGAAGIRHLKELGALTLAQSAETCAVYGMPREAIATGCVDRTLAPDDIAAALVDFARSPSGTTPARASRLATPRPASQEATALATVADAEPAGNGD